MNDHACNGDMDPDLLCILDTETGGLSAQTDPLLEVAAVIWSVKTVCVLSAWSELVGSTTNAAEPVNRIPIAALREGLPRQTVIEKLRHTAAACDVICCHKAEFDRAFIGEDLGRPWLCSKSGFTWPHSKIGDSLVTIALANGVGVSHAHRALTDCLILARLFERVAEVNGVDYVRMMIATGLRPQGLFKSLAPYEDREIVKRAGFEWHPESKLWTRRMAREDAASLPFPVQEVVAV